MRNNRVKKLLVSMIMVATSLMADGYRDATSLIGVEGSYSSMNSELTNAAVYTQDNTDLLSAGVKIGAESGNYRVFLSTRYYADMKNEYEYIGTYGGELQYLFHLSEKKSIFVGASAGIINAKFSIPGESFSRTLSDPYIGGDIGVNFHVRKFLDAELGLRMLSVQATNSRNSVKYRLNTLTSAYASLIFKWQMD